MYTQDQIKKLKDMGAIEHFRTVVNGQYLRNVNRVLAGYVMSVYADASGDKTNFNLSCRQCVFDLFNRAGKLYFQYLKENPETPKAEPKSESKEEEKTEKTVAPGDDEINIIASDDKPKVKRTVKKTVQK